MSDIMSRTCFSLYGSKSLSVQKGFSLSTEPSRVTWKPSVGVIRCSASRGKCTDSVTSVGHRCFGTVRSWQNESRRSFKRTNSSSRWMRSEEVREMWTQQCIYEHFILGILEISLHVWNLNCHLLADNLMEIRWSSAPKGLTTVQGLLAAFR